MVNETGSGGNAVRCAARRRGNVAGGKGEKREMQASRSVVSIIVSVLFAIIALVRCASAVSQRAEEASVNEFSATELASARATCLAGNGFFVAHGPYAFNATCIPLVVRTPTPVGTPTGSAVSGATDAPATGVRTPTP